MTLRSFLTCISLCAIFLTNVQGAGRCLAPVLSFGDFIGRSDDTLADSAYRRQAEELYRKGQYFQAGIAWERVLFGCKDRRQLLAAVLGKTECLKEEGQFDPAVTFLEGWQAFPFPDSGLVRIHSQQILCTYLGGHFESVLSLVDRWPYEHGGAMPDDWLVVLKILSLNELQRWIDAAVTYRAFIGARHPATPVPDLYAHLPRLKSVSKAQMLSTIIPGAGQFYAGRPGEALFSILVQGAGLWFAIVSYEEQYYVSAWLIGAALFGAFHMGGVRRAEVLVKQYNRKKIAAFNEKVKAQLTSLL
jgi:TM2 domain-containing membrane protein YozV